MSDYTAYPYLRIAREHTLPYGTVLAINELLINDTFRVPLDTHSRYAHEAELFFDRKPEEQIAICAEIRKARFIFEGQRAGIRGMDGALIYKP